MRPRIPYLVFLIVLATSGYAQEVAPSAQPLLGGTYEEFTELYGSYSRPIEGRAIWIDAGAIPKDRAGIARLCEEYRKCGFNILMPEVFRNGYTIYPSRIAPQLESFAGFDPLPDLIHEAHKRRMEVHPWVWVFRAGHSGEVGGILKRHPEWAAVGRNGEQVSPGGGRWLCPSNSQAREFLRQVYNELISKYQVDGLHLDYVRFENDSPIPYCYNDECRSRFKAEYGIDPMDIDPLTPVQLSWNLWRERLVNSLVQQVALDVRRMNPRIAVSAAVASEPDNARTGYMQNWPNWAANKWVDFLCPMTYTSGEDRFREWVSAESVKVGYWTHLLPGIGLHLQKDPLLTVEQINTARFLGASGVTLFASSYLQDVHKAALRSGVFSRPTKPPFRATRKQLNRIIKAKRPPNSPVPLAERDAWNLLRYLNYQDSDTGYIAPDPPPVFIPEKIEPIPTIQVRLTSTLPVIDGSLNEPYWENASAVRLECTTMGEPAPVATEVMIGYDDKTLYLGIIAHEPEMQSLKAVQTKRDGPVFYDDSIEIFLDPMGKRTSYFQLAVNTLGTQFDQKILTPAWNVEWQTATKKQADSWTMEIAIPFASIGVSKPKERDVWAVNVARNRWVTGKPEYLVWSVPYGSYNRLFRFGSLTF